jgi:S-adenosylmethionine hydrolase
VPPGLAQRFITLLTDFGLDDDFVGTCRGVIKRIAPEVEVIDITHGIRPQAVLQGALVLANTVPYMPTGIHVAVVDPGVGGERLPLALETSSGAHMVGPDNGLLSIAWKRLGGVKQARLIESRDVILEPLSRTFHGRDVFAPAAAHLASGGALADLGQDTPADRLARISFPAARVRRGRIDCVVTWVDGFGNVELNVRPSMLQEAGLGRGFRVGDVLFPTVATFDAAPEGQSVAVEDSSGFVAVAVNRGSAAELLGLHEGDPVVLN